MPNQLKLAYAVVLGLVVAHDIRTQIEAKKATKLYLKAHQAHEENEAAYVTQIQYLCHMLDKYDIPTDEFDLIALYYNH